MVEGCWTWPREVVVEVEFKVTNPAPIDDAQARFYAALAMGYARKPLTIGTLERAWSDEPGPEVRLDGPFTFGPARVVVG